NDEEIADKLPVVLEQGDVLRLLTPGSGGAYAPHQRDPQALEADIQNEIVTPQAAEREYK
ncbi:MAG: hydantoinase B/oxoprolinase family protein, partial [Candidatus Eremiobacteraeota bacterium]|nr:hydantoinase B/oxoprolinase family protein [Candidatus Eremiobacteraeota bacterium]